MRTIAEIKAELKAKGIKGVSGKKKAELEKMLGTPESGGEKSLKSPKEACSCHDKKSEKPVTKKIKAPTKAPSTKLQNKLTMEAVRAYKKVK
jgi:hypothetical protein